jgi:hypothetical protein
MTYNSDMNDLLNPRTLKSQQNPGIIILGKLAESSGTSTGTQIPEHLNFEQYILEVQVIY